MSKLYNKIFNSIPSFVGDTYLEIEVREEIAKQVEITLMDVCEHSWVTSKQIKLIDHQHCKKCGQVKCKHD